MTALEDRLRERFASVEEPSLVASPDLVRRVRTAHRRRQVLPLAFGTAAVGALSSTLLLQKAPGEPSLAGSEPSPTVTAAPSRGPCSVERLLAHGGPKSIAEFRWPSGAQILALRAPAQNCPILVMLSTPEVLEEDRAAAAARWGDDIVLQPRDDTVSLPVGSAPAPTPLTSEPGSTR